jgi:predicted DNA-binding protein
MSQTRKNITIKVSEEIYDQFTEWCERNETTKTAIILDYINSLLDNEVEDIMDEVDGKIQLAYQHLADNFLEALKQRDQEISKLKKAISNIEKQLQNKND